MCKEFTIVVACIFLAGCEGERLTNVDTAQYQLFQKISTEKSGIDFENTITESLYFNTIIYDNMMTGGGVGLLDVNNDGLLDIFFAGNQVSDRLYLNKGGLRFEDITVSAGFGKKESWTAGVAVADVNGDGWDDLYLCKHVLDDPALRKNMYFENQKDGTFRERASELGIDDAGYSTSANFFDYDLDGDLDLYVGNQPPSSLYERPKIKGIIDYQFTDRLYRNDQARFVDVTSSSGVKNFCYTLSVNTSDFNGDKRPDIYIASDYEEPDYMYINQGDGTFRNVIHEALQHLCTFSMGTDIADINNDGWQDIFTADMVAEDHYRNKTNMSGMNPDKFWNLVSNGYHYQYMFNALQLNNGNGTYSEIAQLAGISHTDWSWATFFIDVDHDGWKDLFVANGQMKDVRNKDFEIRRKSIVEANRGKEDMHDVLFEIATMAPTKKIKNYIFRNNTDLTFESMGDQWGLMDETWSQGAAYGDLDNDGDMDIVINNCNDKALIYASQTSDLKINHYLIVKVEGSGKNTRGIGAKVTVTNGDDTYVTEITPMRGYMSSVQPVAHFGLGGNATVTKVTVEWPDGLVLSKEHVSANQTITMKASEATRVRQDQPIAQPMFNEVVLKDTIAYAESNYDDYAKEILLPYRLSTLGPVTAVADVNGDRLDDIYIGGAAGNSGMLYLQTSSGGLTRLDVQSFGSDAGYEDGCARFFDADGDNDLDLYVCSGSNEWEEGSQMYQDRLYLNDGSGNFTKSKSLPAISVSTSVAEPMDYDNDGDLDIFVGGRQVPGAYGRIPLSLCLRNTNGTYEDVGAQILPNDGKLGMVTDAHWVTSQATTPQLLLAGEWMPIRILQWGGERFEEQTISGLEESEGMWNRIIPVDIDGDGDLDIIAGNCGLNLKYSADASKPFTMIVNDFDHNGTNDVYLGYFDKHDGKCYPVRGRECSSQQMPFVKAKFASYADFANATIQDVLDGRMDGAQQLKCKIFASGIYERVGADLVFHPFRNNAQMSPVYGIVVADFNKDDKLDIFLAGNYFHREVETTRSDAGIGNLLLGKGNLEFTYVHPSETGVIANRDVRNAVLMQGKGDPTMVIVNNGSPAQFYRSNRKLQ